MSPPVTDEPLDNHDRRYLDLASTVGSAVDRWVWAPLEAAWDEPFPHFSELWGHSPAVEPLKRAPKNPQLGSHYGLDREGRVVASRSYRSDGALSYEKFLVYSEAAVSGVTFDHQPWDDDAPPRAIAAVVTVLRDGRVVERVSVNRSDERISYVPTWVEDRVTAIEITTRLGGGMPSSRRFALRYDDDGQLLLIRHVPDGDIVYRRVPANLKRTLATVERGLLDVIVNVVITHRPDGPIAVMGLGFDWPTKLPPTIGIQTEQDFADPSKTPFERWNPGDMTVFVPDYDLDADLDEAIAALNQHIEDTEDIKVLGSIQRRFAKALNAHDWSGKLQLAPHFVAVVVDLDADDILRDIRARLAKPTRAALQDLGRI